MTATTDQLATIAPPTATPPMRTRTFRCDDETWDAAALRAAADGLDLSTVIRHYLRTYTETPPKMQRRRPKRS
jgi:hypothetical protein